MCSEHTENKQHISWKNNGNINQDTELLTIMSLALSKLTWLGSKFCQLAREAAIRRVKSCLASHLARKCSIGFLPSLRNQDLTQDCSRGPPSLERTVGHNTQPRAVQPFDSTHLVRGPRFHLSYNEGKWKGRAGDPGLRGWVYLGQKQARGAQQPGLGQENEGPGNALLPAQSPSRAPQPCAAACVSLRRPLLRAPRPRSLRRTRAASRRARRGGGRGRPAPNLSDPRSRPGAAGAARERSVPLPRGSGPSCASRPYRAGWGRGDERRPRGSAPGRRAAPSRSRGVSKPALRPPPHPPLPGASELVGCDGAPLIYNVFRFPQDGEGCAAVPSGTGAPVK